jgi:hypothetical protein
MKGEREIASRAAQLVDAYLRGYLSQPGRPPLDLEELADLAYVARQHAEKEAQERAQEAASAVSCCQS